MMGTKLVWVKRAVVIALILAAIGGIMFSRREERKATDHLRLIRVGWRWEGIVRDANTHFLRAASSNPVASHAIWRGVSHRQWHEKSCVNLPT